MKFHCSFQLHPQRRGRALRVSFPYRRTSPVQSPKALAQRSFSLPAGACCCSFDCSVLEIDNDHGKKKNNNSADLESADKACACTLHQLNGSKRRCTTWFIEHVVSDRLSSMRGFRLHGVFRLWIATRQFRRPSQHSCLCTCIRKGGAWLLDFRTVEPSADVASMSSTVQVRVCSRVEHVSTRARCECL